MSGTPGPWRVSYYSDGLTVSSMTVGSRIGNLSWSKIDETAMADARLVAAAPELLDAVKELCKPDTDRTLALRLADAALAKVEGRNEHHRFVQRLPD